MVRHLLPWVVLLVGIVGLSGCQEGPAGQQVVYAAAGEGYRRVDLPVEGSGPAVPSLLEVDLDADGQPEQVRLEAGRVWIEREGQTAWRGEAAWQVVDMAAGDVDDDLRREVLLAFWKPDPAGVLRSHPFLVGHRGGVYGILWGGSAAVDPICEVELGDVDGDGRTELVVLEGSYDEPPDAPGRFLTVWRWNGWGFTLLWRSEPGSYRQLQLLDLDAAGGLEIVLETGVDGGGAR